MPPFGSPMHNLTSGRALLIAQLYRAEGLVNLDSLGTWAAAGRCHSAQDINKRKHVIDFFTQFEELG